MAERLDRCGFDNCQRLERTRADVLRELMALDDRLRVVMLSKTLADELRRTLATAGFELAGGCEQCAARFVSFFNRQQYRPCGHPARSLPEVCAAARGMAASIKELGGPERVGPFEQQAARCLSLQLGYELGGQCHACAIAMVASVEGVALA
jgi:hypothetical protein